MCAGLDGGIWWDKSTGVLSTLELWFAVLRDALMLHFQSSFGQFRSVSMVLYTGFHQILSDFETF